MDHFEPYAAPATDALNPPETPFKDEGADESNRASASTGGLAKSHANAIKRLNEHLANPQTVTLDQAARGGRIQSSTLVVTGVTAMMAIGCAIWKELNPDPSDRRNLVFAILISVIVGSVALAAIISDLLSAPAKGNTPIEAMEQFLKAVRATRFGYAWAMLTPTAREERVTAPNLGALPVDKTSHVLQNVGEFERYIASFWRSPTGNYLRHWRSTLVEEKGNVAIVKIDAHFRRERLWLIGLSFLLGLYTLELIPLGVLLAMLFGGRSHRIGFLKTLIRGSDGHWYMYSGNFFESINEEPRVGSPPK